MSITAETRALVLARARQRCERCWASGPLDIHHRRARAAGGSRRHYTDQPCNLLALCRACHRWATEFPRAAADVGYVVWSWEDPSQVNVGLYAEVPSVHRCCRYLHNDGTYRIKPDTPEPPGVVERTPKVRKARPSARVLRLAAARYASEHPEEWEALVSGS